MPAKYRLNTLLARLPHEARLVIGQLEYDCDHQLEELRVQYGNTHLIKRGHDGISVVSLEKDAEVVGTQCEIPLESRPDLAQTLVKEWLARSLEARGLRIHRTRQSVDYISERPDSNILNEVLPPGISFPEGIGRPIAAHFDVRRIREASGQMSLVICIDVRTRMTLDCRLPTLLGVGLDVVGLYVQREVDTAFGRRRRLAGRVEAVRGDSLILTDCDEGVAELSVTDAWLEPRRENFDRVVKAVARLRTPEILEGLRIRVAERVGGAQRHELAQKWVEAIGKLPPDIAQGVQVEFDARLLGADSDDFPPYEVYRKPQLVFDPGRTRVSEWNQGGLDKYGPYNFERFAPVTVRTLPQRKQPNTRQT